MRFFFFFNEVTRKEHDDVKGSQDEWGRQIYAATMEAALADSYFQVAGSCFRRL
jgi:hypothetical protein